MNHLRTRMLHDDGKIQHVTWSRSAIESAQNDQVTLMQNMLMNKEKHVRKIQELFGRLGATDDGHITLQMFEENINSDSVTTYFEALGLDAYLANGRTLIFCFILVYPRKVELLSGP